MEVPPDQLRLLEVLSDALGAMGSAIVGGIHLDETQLLGESLAYAVGAIGVYWAIARSRQA